MGVVHKGQFPLARAGSLEGSKCLPVGSGVKERCVPVGCEGEGPKHSSRGPLMNTWAGHLLELKRERERVRGEKRNVSED